MSFTNNEIAGETDPVKLAAQADWRIKDSSQQLRVAALNTRMDQEVEAGLAQASFSKPDFASDDDPGPMVGIHCRTPAHIS